MCIMNTGLDQQVKTALAARKGEWQEVAKQTGVSYSWISKFMNGHIENPGFATLKSLHAALCVRKPRKKAEA